MNIPTDQRRHRAQKFSADATGMRALVFRGPEDLALVRREKPSVERDDDVLVALAATGICGTDRAIVTGRVPARPGTVLGHEAIGFVAATGAGIEDLEPGAAVIVNPTFWCGACDNCLRGDLGVCRRKSGRELGVDRDGTLADQLVIERRFVEPIPPGLSLRDAIFVEPIACVLNNAAEVELRPDDAVLIIGGGPIGALWALFAQGRVARVLVLERSPYRAQRLRELGVETDIPGREPAEDLVRSRFDGGLPHVVVETTGSLFDEALAIVDVGGSVIAMGFNADALAAVQPFDVTTRGVSIIGAADYSGMLFPAAVSVAESLRPGRLITHALALERYDEAFRRLSVAPDGRGETDYSAMKVVIESMPGVLDGDRAHHADG
jgi:threonine dehydrogenase-like Zn-dependent dehydrogenase